MSDRVSITLGPMDGAIIFRADGSEELQIPHMNEVEEVPPHLLLMLAFVGRLSQDNGFEADMLEWLNKQPRPALNA